MEIFCTLGSGRKRNEYVNVLTRMDDAVGPLSFLKKCMDQKLRVKVSFFPRHLNTFNGSFLLMVVLNFYRCILETRLKLEDFVSDSSKLSTNTLIWF